MATICVALGWVVWGSDRSGPGKQVSWMSKMFSKRGTGQIKGRLLILIFGWSWSKKKNLKRKRGLLRKAKIETHLTQTR